MNAAYGSTPPEHSTRNLPSRRELNSTGLLWINCRGEAERALKAADLLLHAGGFGLMIFDLADVPERAVRRISMGSWFDFGTRHRKPAPRLLPSRPPRRRAPAHPYRSIWRARNPVAGQASARPVVTSRSPQAFPVASRFVCIGALMFCCVFAPGNLPVLLDCARQFSPTIEEHPDMVVFDIRGLESLHGFSEGRASINNHRDLER